MTTQYDNFYNDYINQPIRLRFVDSVKSFDGVLESVIRDGIVLRSSDQTSYDQAKTTLYPWTMGFYVELVPTTTGKQSRAG